MARHLAQREKGRSVKKHYDFAATLFEIKAFAPDFKLLFLHGIKDVVESWDNLRHAPAGYERELYALANMYYRTPDKLARATTGLLGCLADGIRAEEWRYIRRNWHMAFDGDVIQAGEVTAVWSDELLEGAVDDYLQDGMWCSHWQITKLMENNVQIQSSVRFENVGRVKGALYLPSAHLLPRARLEELLRDSTRPIIFSGRAEQLSGFFSMAQVVSDGQFAVVVFDDTRRSGITQVARGTRAFEPNRDALDFMEDMNRLDIADELFEKATTLVNLAATDALRTRNELYAECPNVNRGDCTVNTRLIGERTIDVAIENTTQWGRLVKSIRVSQTIDTITILSSFPLRILRKPDDFTFEVIVPTRGITVVRVTVKPAVAGSPSSRSAK